MANLNGNYYVIPTGWEGLSEAQCIEIAEYLAENGNHRFSGSTVHATYEAAREEVARLWDEEMAPDEVVYLVHPNGEVEEY